MSRILRVFVAFLFFAALIPAIPAQAARSSIDLPPNCHPGATPDGSLVVVCLPANPTGDAVIFAHGYVSPFIPAPYIPEDQLVLPDGTSLPALVNSLGFTFAVTSYPQNGLAIQPGVTAVDELAGLLKAQ